MRPFALPHSKRLRTPSDHPLVRRIIPDGKSFPSLASLAYRGGAMQIFTARAVNSGKAKFTEARMGPVRYREGMRTCQPTGR